MKILHILREPADAFSREVMERQSREHQITVVVTGEASSSMAGLPGRKMALGDGGGADATGAPVPGITYGDLLDLIFRHDRLFCW